MPDSPERLKLLFQRYLSSIASAQETRELMTLIDKDQHHHEIKQLISEQLKLYDAGRKDSIASLEKSRADELLQNMISGFQETAEPAIPRIGK